MNYTETSITPNIPWRATTRGSSNKQQGRLSKSNVSPVGNGATNYGELRAGTILARDSNGLLHPLGLAKVAVAGANTAQACTYNPVNKTITFTSATNGGSAATSTHADLVSSLMNFSNLIESASSATPATTVAALATTALESAKFGAIASARTITVIATNTLTLSGAVFTAAIDDIVLKDGAYKPVGILDETVSTVRYVGTTAVAEDLNVAVAYEGDARDSSTYLPNLSAGVAGDVVKRALGGYVYVDPGVDPSVAAPTEVMATEIVGFRFRSV